MKGFVFFISAIMLGGEITAQEEDRIFPLFNINYTSADNFNFHNSFDQIEHVIDGKKHYDYTSFITKPQVGFDIGFEWQRQLHKNGWFVTGAQLNFNQFEIEKERGNPMFELASDKIYGNNYRHSFNLLYFCFPFKYSYFLNVPRKLSFSAGIHSCFLIHSKTIVDDLTGNITNRSLEGMRTFLLNPTIGIQYDISKFLSVHLIYEQGLEDVVNSNHPLYEYGGKLAYWSVGASFSFKKKDVNSVQL